MTHVYLQPADPTAPQGPVECFYDAGQSDEDDHGRHFEHADGWPTVETAIARLRPSWGAGLQREALNVWWYDVGPGDAMWVHEDGCEPVPRIDRDSEVLP